MFADIAGYTAIMQRDESEAKKVRDSFRTLLHDVARQHAGEIVQFYGDGALIIFDSVKEAVLAAIGIPSTAVREPGTSLRIGIHLGDVVVDESGVFGDGVNVAARIESEMGNADPAAQWTMNACLAGIGIRSPKHRKRDFVKGYVLESCITSMKGGIYNE